MVSNQKRYNGRFLLLFALSICLGLGGILFAQEQPKPKAKNYDGLQNEDLRYGVLDVNNFLRNNAYRKPEELNEKDLFRIDLYTRQWNKVRDTLQEMPKDLSEKVYGRLLWSFTQGQKPYMSMEDVIGVIDACPCELKSDWLKQLGAISKAVVLPEEQGLFALRLEKGTRLVGGSDPAKKLLAGRILMYATMNDFAKKLLPTSDEASRISDQQVRTEILLFHGALIEVEKQKAELATDTEKEWNKISNDLLNETSRDKQEQLIQKLWQMIANVPAETVAKSVQLLYDRQPNTAFRLVLTIESRVIELQNWLSDSDKREENVKTIVRIGNALDGKAPFTQQPWNQIPDTIATIWIQEVERMVKERPEYEKRRADPNAKMNYVLPETLLELAPKGAWSGVLSKDVTERVTLATVRAMLNCQDSDKAIDLILDVNKRNTLAAGILAQAYLQRWAEQHNPEIPEGVRSRYQLPQGSAIIVTPFMIERNVEGLAKIMEMMRKNNIVPESYEKIMAAFEVCYGSAEVYRAAHIEKVFGPVANMNEELFRALLRSMTTGLGNRWRLLATQTSMITGRGQNQILLMVRAGYGDTVKMVDEWTSKNPDGWKAYCTAATMLSDWADFEYFQELGAATPQARMIAYKEKNSMAAVYFQRAADAYARTVGKLSEKDYTAEVYIAWFNSMLGLNSNGDINLSKAMNQQSLIQLRKAIRALPNNLATAHLKLFSEYIDQKRVDGAKPLPPEIKYKFVASALVVTEDTPFAAKSKDQVDYYNDLLKEVRLQTRIDGSNTISRKQDFGIIISMVHSEAMGRLMKFEKYLQMKAPDQNPNRGNIKRMDIVKNARNEFEKNIYESLAVFFDIKSVTFSPKDVLPRSSEKPGWQETVLAYVQVSVKDASVDRVPPIDMNLDYFDKTGPVQIPVTSPETLIKIVEDKTGPRPHRDVKIVQTLDTRKLFVNGLLKIDVTASGSGLMPDLQDLVNLDVMEKQAPVQKIDDISKGALPKDLMSWSDRIEVTSQRQWSILLDSKPIITAEKDMDFMFPQPRDTNTVVQNETYQDAELVKVAGNVLKLNRSKEHDTVTGVSSNGTVTAVTIPQRSHKGLWLSIAGGIIGIIIIVVIIINRIMNPKERPLRAKDVFHMPEKIDPFVVVRLLRSMSISPLVSLDEKQREQLIKDIQNIEDKCFDPGNTGIEESSLSETARRWLKEVC